MLGLKSITLFPFSIEWIDNEWIIEKIFKSMILKLFWSFFPSSSLNVKDGQNPFNNRSKFYYLLGNCSLHESVHNHVYYLHCSIYAQKTIKSLSICMLPHVTVSGPFINHIWQIFRGYIIGYLCFHYSINICH